jgi:transposase InsO family protein
MSTSSIYSVDKLEASNFSSWKLRLKMILIDRGLWEVVDGTELKPAPDNKALYDAFIKKDNQALAQIVLTLSNSQLVHVRNASSSRDAWRNICSAFEAKGLAAKVYLRRQFFTIKFTDSGSMQDHINKIRDLADQLNEMEAGVSDEDLAMTLLCSLPDRFDPLIVSLESRPSKDLTSDFVINRLLAEERRQLESTQSNGVVQAANKARVSAQVKCTFCKKPNHTEATCYRKHGYPTGHPLHGKQASAQAASSGILSNTNALNYSAVSVCCLTSAFVSSSASSSSFDWLIDSGASTHICHQRSSFSSLRPLDQPVVINVADGRAIRALAIGDIALDVRCAVTHEWSATTLRDVLFAPDLKMNLISVSRLTRDGWIVSFFDSQCRIALQDNRLVASSIKDSSDLYRVTSRIADHRDRMSASVSAVNSDPKLWHARLGHLNTNAMQRLVRKQMVDGLPALPTTNDIGVCEGCALGKSHRAAMPKHGTSRATRLLELVHSDICGPMQVDSLGGKKYFITFIDDYSRAVIVRTIAKKSEAYDSFITFKAWAENLTGHRIKSFRSDRGGEYNSNAFTKFLELHGIAHQQSPAYTPEHNGVAERANRTLMEMARSMIYAAGLDLSYWGEAVICAAYLRNRCPTNAISSDRTPYELWYGKKPNLQHLRVFGCKAYVHIPDQKRPKLDAKSLPCIFIGYSDISKAYRFFDPASHCVRESRDAIFDESSVKSHSPDHRVEWEDLLLDQSDDPDSSREVVVQRDDRSDAIIVDNNDDSDDSDDPASAADVSDVSDSDEKDSDSSRASSSSDASDVDEDVPLAPSSLPQPQPQPQSDVSLRRSTRVRVPPIPYWDVQQSEQQRSQMRASHSHQALVVAGLTFISKEPVHFRQVAHRSDHKQWEDAMQAEYDSIQRAGTWTLVPLPAGRKAIGCRWVYRIKHKADGAIDRYKARLVAQGFSQKEGVDFNETFAPVAKFCSIRALLALGAYQDLEIHQMDVNTAFLNGDLDEEIYMRQPDGYVVPGKEHLVCKLDKSLYGLKQAGRSWYTKIDNVLLELGFDRLEADHCVYQFHDVDLVIYIALYVDDLLILSNSTPRLDRFKRQLSQIFDMKDLGEAHYVLGFQIHRDRQARTLSISQGEYIKNVLDRFDMLDCKPVATPLATGVKLLKSDCPSSPEDVEAMSAIPYQQAIGAIMYAMQGTRPDIAYAVTALSQFSHNPGHVHWTGVKRLLRYLRGTIDFKLTYAGSPSSPADIRSFPALSGFCDADWGSDLNDRRSITGYVFTLAGGAISWQSKKQPTVALSSVEAEYMASTQATKEALWWRTFLKELGFSIESPTQLFSDSQGSIALAKNPEYHSRTKHIDIQHHFVREHVANHNVCFDFVGTESMVADVLTKALPRDSHNKFVKAMGITSGLPSLSGSVADVADRAV